MARDAQPAPHGGPDKLLIDLPLPLKDAVLRHLRLFKLRANVGAYLPIMMIERSGEV